MFSTKSFLKIEIYKCNLQNLHLNLYSVELRFEFWYLERAWLIRALNTNPSFIANWSKLVPPLVLNLCVTVSFCTRVRKMSIVENVKATNKNWLFAIAVIIRRSVVSIKLPVSALIHILVHLITILLYKASGVLNTQNAISFQHKILTTGFNPTEPVVHVLSSILKKTYQSTGVPFVLLDNFFNSIRNTRCK